MTKRTLRSKKTRTKLAPRMAGKKRTPKPKKALGEQSAAEAPKPEPIDHAVAAGFRDFSDTTRLLGGTYGSLEIGKEDHGNLMDLVYTAFAGELKLEIGMLTNLSMMANGIVQAVLAGNWMNESEFRHYVYGVARDIRDRARSAAQLLQLRESGIARFERGEEGAS